MEPQGTARLSKPPTTRSLHLLGLMKPRVGVWILIATASGYAMARGGEIRPARLLAALTGTALVTFGAAAINQFLERQKDALMARTQGRPLPSHRVSPRAALFYGASLAVTGLSVLVFWTTAWAAILAATALALYLAAYTPMKHRTPACTTAGAIAGALPPAIGWTANDGGFEWHACLLVGLLLLWQIPHLLAITWLHRDEYTAAGYALWGQRDARGHQTAKSAFGFAVLVAAVAQGAAVLSRTGPLVFFPMLLLNAALIGFAFRFLRTPSPETARGLFLATLGYLPLALGSLVFGAHR